RLRGRGPGREARPGPRRLPRAREDGGGGGGDAVQAPAAAGRRRPGMTRERSIDSAFFVVAGGLALLLTTASRQTAVAVAQPIVLAFALAFAVQSAAAFEADNPVRRPWQILSLGLLSWLLGETTEAVYLVALGRTDPFPSLADLFFGLAYPGLIVSLFLF